MQVRQVPLRHELGQAMPPCSSDSNSGWSGQASHWALPSAVRAVKKGALKGDRSDGLEGMGFKVQWQGSARVWCAAAGV